MESYHWASQDVGLLQIPLAIGSLFSIPIIGFGSDWTVKYLARKNNGLHQVSTLVPVKDATWFEVAANPSSKPEHTLICLVLPLVCGAIGTLCFGISAGNPEHYHWAVPMTMTGLQYFGVNSVNVVSMTYAIECYPDLAEPVAIVIGACRNIIGFALIYGVDGFVASVGLEACFGTYAALIAGFFLLGWPFLLMGPKMRVKINRLRMRHFRSGKQE